MRLKSMKMSGFKSFVDLTHLIFKDNLTGIVGPNGCGKSNIVDAIHCVLGSSSKYLRAEMMADVIFNGTNARKPVAQAAIELLFDNSTGRIGGEYAQYAEIAVRRELSRDGQSTYSINGTRCRRRDITDIFLGTGLGQTSYAIIEQGMISRLIEAKPEELRAHVEEAAGTSKYKERRRETENRIKHTRENLERLNDLREEQNKQLNHLQRQANAAERFKTLKQEQRLLRAQLQAILWKDLAEQITIVDSKIKEQETILEAKQAEITHIDAEMESKRSVRIELNDQVNEIQSSYYGLGAEIKNIEQQINHAKERKRQLENDYHQVETSYQELTEQQLEDQTQYESLTSSTTDIEALYAESNEQSQSLKEELSTAESTMHQWQEQWDEFQRNSAQTSKQLEVEKTKIHHLEQKQQNLLQRIARIRDEKTQQNTDETLQAIMSLKDQQVICQARIEELQTMLESLQAKIADQRGVHQDAQQQVAQLTKELRDFQAKYASLEALQRIALGKSDTEITAWLAEKGLEKNPRLAEGITVESGWEIAVEVVLSQHLDAICVNDFTDINEVIANLNRTNVSFYNLNSASKNEPSSSKLVPLHSKLSSNWRIDQLLGSIYCAENLEDALQSYHLLSSNESIVTRDGIWLSQTWLRIVKQVDKKTGVLQREQDIKEVQQQIADKQTELENIEKIAHKSQELLNFYTEEREALQQQYQTTNAKNSDCLAQIRAKEDYAAQLELKYSSLTEEMRENDLQLIDVEKTLDESKQIIEQISEQAFSEKNVKEELLTKKDNLRNSLDAVKEKVITSKQKTDELKVRLESNRNQIHYLSQNITRTERQLSAIQERRIALNETLSQINDPLPELSAELQTTLDKRVIVEEQLKNAKFDLETVENSVQSLEKNRQHIEKSQLELRNFLEEKRLGCQTLIVKQQTCLEQIQETNFVLDEILQQLPPDHDATLWEENIVKIDNRITRLGPINLAAIDEYAQLQEKATYLTKQYDDLVEALTTLENAIKKIDRETRQRFKETYNLLNESFKSYFNQIFGGGAAYLELTSDDLLETGVIVRAQPPGKKNTTIHLLSGGEKALTAIALVFAIFNLNPAPFCVLDEVDAPLDDANVIRFCNLVKKMSEKIQFLFISHNKIAIEMAQQLIGVTMHEPGVSRLVSVDIDQAIDMATT